MKKLKKNKEVRFLEKYLNDYIKILVPNNDILLKLKKVKEILISASKNNGKILIFGNGGSAAIASHVSVDLTKNARIRSVNFNEADLITCFANDYGFENWIREALKNFCKSGDLVILISSSGESNNMIRAAKYLNKNKQNTLITFTGFKKNNKLSVLGDHNIWINSNNYNLVEMVHHILLVAAIDKITNIKI